ncbi:hypothetical protein MMC21_002192 [Puttea exsequens]|nr:hypothetical protein [Puttea exsequens]
MATVRYHDLLLCNKSAQELREAEDNYIVNLISLVGEFKCGKGRTNVLHKSANKSKAKYLKKNKLVDSPTEFALDAIWAFLGETRNLDQDFSDVPGGDKEGKFLLEIARYSTNCGSILLDSASRSDLGSCSMRR